MSTQASQGLVTHSAVSHGINHTRPIPADFPYRLPTIAPALDHIGSLGVCAELGFTFTKYINRKQEGRG